MALLVARGGRTPGELAEPDDDLSGALEATVFRIAGALFERSAPVRNSMAARYYGSDGAGRRPRRHAGASQNIWQRDAAVSFENDPANWEGLLRETARERFAGHIH